MHKIYGLFLIVLCLGCSSTMDPDEVPPGVLRQFDSAFKGKEVEKLYWNRLEHGYEANFLVNGVQMEIEYDLQDRLREMETIIKKSDLPQKVLDYVDENYPMLYISEVSVEERDGRKVYELELLNGFFMDMELEFDMEGNLTGKEMFTE